MGIAAISGTGMAGFLLAPLQALVGFFAPWQAAAAQATRQVQATGQAGTAASAGVAGKGQAKVSSGTPALNGMVLQPASGLLPVLPAQVSRLRVIRVMDAGSPPHTAGRMLISGRMADVCAELDRMAHREATAAAQLH